MRICVTNKNWHSSVEQDCAKELKDEVGPLLCKYFTRDTGFFTSRSTYKAMNVVCQDERQSRQNSEVLSIDSRLKLENTLAQGHFRHGNCTVRTITCGYTPPKQTEKQDGRNDVTCED